MSRRTCRKRSTRGEFVRLYIADVFGIRTRMGLSHEAFARALRADAAELRDWEAMGGVPDERSARICG